MSPAVSVVIPVYNAEKYIDKTLDCVLQQTLRDIEVICVDDGSVDSSLKLLNARAKTDSRLRVISQENCGAGAARNTGLEVASGEYLSFLDSDDVFELSMLETALAGCKKDGADIGVFRCDMFDDSTGKTASGAWALRDEYLPVKRPFNMKDMPDRLFFAFVGWAWDKLFLRSFIIDNGLRFQNLRTTNDMLFVFSALVCARSITIIDKVLAHQRRRASDSLSVTREKSWKCFKEALDALGAYIKGAHVYTELEKCYINYCVHFALWNLNTITGEAYQPLYEYIREVCFPEWAIADKPSDFFMNQGELKQARRIIDMPFSTYAAHMINGARRDAGARDELNAIKKSVSYRVGRAITYLPRLLRGEK